MLDVVTHLSLVSFHKIILLNAKYEAKNIQGMYREYLHGASLVDLCGERGLFLANKYFKHKMIHRCSWRRGNGQNEQKRVIVYVALDAKLR